MNALLLLAALLFTGADAIENGPITLGGWAKIFAAMAALPDRPRPRDDDPI